jgi:hypothetical protein
VKLDVPVAVGVPSRSPEGLRFNPAGRLPEEIAQLYGVVPPDAENDMLYWVPTVPVGREAVVIERAAAAAFTVMLTVATLLSAVPSLALYVKLSDPL